MSNLWRFDFWKTPKKNPFAPPAEAPVAESLIPKEMVKQSLDSLENLYLESMAEEELRDHAKSKGVKVHPRAGRDKIIAALKEAK